MNAKICELTDDDFIIKVAEFMDGNSTIQYPIIEVEIDIWE